jgi:hypothetical protein
MPMPPSPSTPSAIRMAILRVRMLPSPGRANSDQTRRCVDFRFLRIIESFRHRLGHFHAELGGDGLGKVSRNVRGASDNHTFTHAGCLEPWSIRNGKRG